MLKRLAKISLLMVCVFSSVSAFAWQCEATNARHNGVWYGSTPYNGPIALSNAQNYALQYCQSAMRTINPETCHIVTCYQN
jgi:hypothetical protein